MVPIVVICFNNYKYVDNTINQIGDVNVDLLQDIIIVNNSSTCEQTISYLKNTKHKVLWRETNQGPWISPYVNCDIYNSLPDKYIITDPDLEFNKSLPKNFIEIMNGLSDKYSCEKIGFALDISDFNKMYNIGYVGEQTIYDYEKQYWENRINDEKYELYSAGIDTTFVMMNKNYFAYNQGVCIRIAGDFTAKHLPWYVKNKIYNHYELYTMSLIGKDISTVSRIVIPHTENKYAILKKNNEMFLIENDENNTNLSFWKNTYSYWENETFEVFDTYLDKEKILIDIGGWIGTTTMYGSRKSKQVYCIEADGKSFVDLKSNCEINCEKNITLINNAIYNVDNIEIKFGKNKFINNSKMNDSTSQIYSSEESSEDFEIVRTITLNRIIEQYKINPRDISLIKVDIEGGEEFILNDLHYLYEIYKIPMHISFHYDWWKNKDLNRFSFLKEDQKNLITLNPFISILFN